METKQIIQSSANVVRLTKLSPGDVYKRFDKSYDDRTYYGIVKNVHNDGVNTIIEATEYCYKYSNINVEHRTLRGEQDYILFPAEPKDLQFELDKCKKRMEREITEYQEKIEQQQRLISEVDGLI